jgi:hypothetical protein
VALSLSVPWVLGMVGAAAVLHRPQGPSLASLVVGGGGSATTALLLATLLGLLPLLLAYWLTPSESSGETPSATVVLALRRKLPSTTDKGMRDPTDDPG